MKAKRPQDEPDAFVYRDDERVLQRFCRHCATLCAVPARSEGGAFREAQMHLWATHSMRRVWVDYSNPEHAHAVQMALPIVLAHNTTRTR